MGTRMGPLYACLFMGFIESKFHEDPILQLHKHYIYDISGAMTILNLLKYMDSLPTFNDAIESTRWISLSDIIFMDCHFNINVSPRKINASAFYNANESHPYSTTLWNIKITFRSHSFYDWVSK